MTTLNRIESDKIASHSQALHTDSLVTHSRTYTLMQLATINRLPETSENL